jgi:hypothetical protein
MAREPKTKPTTASPAAFLDAVADEKRRADGKEVDKLLREWSGEQPVMWGESIVGYGTYPSASGPWPRVGFSPRKANHVIYVMDGYKDKEALLARLGKHKTGSSCLYLNRLSDVDLDVLKEIVQRSLAAMRERYG